LGLGEFIAILMMLWASIRTMVQRKGTPLAEAVMGMIINVIVTVSGIALLDGLLSASDVLTNDLLDIPFGGTSDLGERMGKVLLVTGGFDPMAQLIMALVVLLVGVSLAVMMFLRQAALPVQALLLPIAGAGQIGGKATRQWLPRLWTSMIMVIAYKPAAALLVAVGFFEIGNGVSIADWIRGVVTLLFAIGALPTMMIFAPLGIAAAGATSGGFAQSVMAMGMMSGGFGRGGSSGASGGSQPISAVQHAAQMARTAPAANPPGAINSAVDHAARTTTPPTGGPGGRQTSSPQPGQPGAPGQDGSAQVPQQDSGQQPGQRPQVPGPSPQTSGLTVTMRTTEATSRAANLGASTVSGNRGENDG
jgi:type IV secretion system protein TrbL